MALEASTFSLLNQWSCRYKLESGPNIDDPMQWGADKDLEFLRSHRHPTYYSDFGSQLKVVIPLAD